MRAALRLAACLLLVAVAGFAHAQPAGDYPSKPVRLVVPFPPGGPADISARVLASELSGKLGQQVIVDNRGGANGNIGAEAVARAASDGYTMLLVASNHAANATLYSKLSYSLVRDFTPVAGMLYSPFVLVVHPSVPARTVSELVALAQSKPGELTYASAGSGGGAHLAAELFKSMAKADILHVPFKGTAPALVDVVGGRVNVMFAAIAGTMNHVAAGRLRALGVTGTSRLGAHPEIPTIAEAGVPGYAFAGWFGFLMPAGTPRPLADKMHGSIAEALRTPAMTSRLATDGNELLALDPDQFGKFVASEIDVWARIIRISGSKAE